MPLKRTSFWLLKATDFQFLKKVPNFICHQGNENLKPHCSTLNPPERLKWQKDYYQVLRKTWNNKNLHILQGRVNWHNHLGELFDSTYYSWLSMSILWEILKRRECTGPPKDMSKNAQSNTIHNPTYLPTIEQT